MAGRRCKARAGDGIAESAPWSASASARMRRAAQSIAPLHLPFSRRGARARVLSCVAAAFLAACAAPSPDPAVGESGSTGNGKPGWTADAFVPLEDGVRLLRFGGFAAAEHARPDSMPRWLTLAAPAGAFRPVQAVWAQRGYFLLADAASSRLCLYDADAALLSTFPLPEAFTPFTPGRAAVFRGADGAFTFLDYTTGEAWQYADRLTGDGNARWVLRGRTRFPTGVRACVQPPGATSLLCRMGRDTPVQFDGALNRVPARGVATGVLTATWERDGDAGADGAQWVITHETSRARFLPAQRRMESPPAP